MIIFPNDVMTTGQKTSGIRTIASFKQHEKRFDNIKSSYNSKSIFYGKNKYLPTNTLKASEQRYHVVL